MNTCKWCPEKAHAKQGRIFLCVKHYRFQTMRSKAAADGKSVPGYCELENLLCALDKMRCPACRRKMNWLSADGQDTVLSLQHDREGGHRLLCRSCNTRHAGMPNDLFYSLKDGERWCPCCERILPESEFCKDNHRSKRIKTYCRGCSLAKHAEWVANNRKKYNASRRSYYHARKESGNPIPR